jgi:ADP-ribose diphosphatase
MDEPKIVDSKTVFRGKVFTVSTDTVQEGDAIYQRDVVHHPGSAVIIPLFPDNTVALVKQYRHPALRYLLEAPAGTLEERESPETGAARELEEELGLRADRLELLSEFYVSPGFCEEKMWLYLATDLSESKQDLDEDEIIQVVKISLDDALEMVSDGEIEDAKTIIALLLTANHMKIQKDAVYPAV